MLSAEISLYQCFACIIRLHIVILTEQNITISLALPVSSLPFVVSSRAVPSYPGHQHGLPRAFTRAAKIPWRNSSVFSSRHKRSCQTRQIASERHTPRNAMFRHRPIPIVALPPYYSIPYHAHPNQTNRTEPNRIETTFPFISLYQLLAINNQQSTINAFNCPTESCGCDGGSRD